MDFQNVNLLNSRANLLSGNLLPIMADSAIPFSTSWRLYSALVWLLELVHTGALISGLALVPHQKALMDGTVACVVTVEASLMFSRLYVRKRLIRRMIGMMNSLLSSADDTMMEIVELALRPVKLPFTIYGIVSVVSVTLWTAQPLILVFEKASFLYVDYNLPAAFCREPFSTWVLISSTIVMTLGSIYLFLKKFSVDIYMIHLVLLLTAQYRYVAMRLTALFRILQSGRDRLQIPFGMDQWAEKELRALCRYQNTVLQISFMLRQLLSVNFSLLYLNSVFRFCFIGILMTTIPSMNLTEAVSVVSFTLGSLTQFFLLCFSVQTLLDASTEITDQAFDEAWYQCTTSMKRTFVLLIMTNNLECRIAAIGKFNLSLPSFMTIMNQSYSIALLFLRAK